MSLIQNIEFDALANAAPVLIWIADKSKNCIWFNDYWLQFTGKTMKEEYGNGWAEGVHPEDLEDCFKTYVEHFEKKIPFKMQYRLRYNDGQYRWILDHGVPYYDQKGEFQGYIGSCTDITENVNAQLETKRVLETIYDGYWDWDILRDYEYMSPHFWQMLGHDYKEKKHHPSEWQKIIFPEDLELSKLHLKQHVSSRGQIPFNLELKFKHFNGHTVFILCRGRVIEWDASGNPLRMVGTHTDISDLKKAQNVLFQSAKLLEMGELSAGIAHEINNPLTIIISRSEKLEKNFSSLNLEDLDLNQTLNGITQIKNMAHRIHKIVQGLKTFSRNTENDPMVIFNFFQIMEEVLQLMNERFKYGPVQLLAEINEAKDITIKGISTQILQVLINLLNNAYDAAETQLEKWVELKIRKNPEHIIITVTDSGQGISQQIISKMFNPFFTTKELGKGTGLGLSISKKIIEDHSGSLYYDQNSPHTCFVVKLPRFTN